MTLTIPDIKNAKLKDKAYKLADEKGLYLLIHPNGSKYWRLKYRFVKKEKTLALGVYPDVSLSEARSRREDARLNLRNGIDPGVVKKEQLSAKALKVENSFQSQALEWWQRQKGRWSEGHAQRVWLSLETDVFPHIGQRPITEITTPEVLAVIRKVEHRGALDVAGRVLQRCTAIFRFAIQSGRASYNPATELTGVLETRKTKHRAALPRAELPEFLKRLSCYDGNAITRLALRLLMLTFVRPGELRFAKWDEFDLDNKVWRIPAERMKMGTEHIVPLSCQAIAVLDELSPITGNDNYLFTGERSRLKPISENTMIYAMYRMGYKSRATPHGFRTNASSILNEEGFTPDAIERQLSHLERNKVRGAYTQHAEYLPERIKMMSWWANYLDELESGSNVIAGSFGAGAK
ncbi:MAG: tyrosine-type recombinase/integrase [Gammaproteobacteria bacterium]|nr:tyrosine-type recombinase/integrase [Gammaproteobacteria bacterium]